MQSVWSFVDGQFGCRNVRPVLRWRRLDRRSDSQKQSGKIDIYSVSHCTLLTWSIQDGYTAMNSPQQTYSSSCALAYSAQWMIKYTNNEYEATAILSGSSTPIFFRSERALSVTQISRAP